MKKTNSYSNSDSNNFNDNFRYLCLTTAVPSGKSRSFSIRNAKGAKIEVAVFNIDGKYYAISNTCKHEGGPLSQGILKGKIVTCPWHGWKYSVINGKAPHKGGDSVDSYETKVRNGELFVSSSPSNLGKRVTEPHKTYTNLKNSVNSFLNHEDKDALLAKDIDRKRNVLGISTTNLNDKIASRKSTSE